MLELRGSGRSPDGNDERAAAHHPADSAHDEAQPDTRADHDERGTDDPCDVRYERGTHEHRPADAVGYSDH